MSNRSKRKKRILIVLGCLVLLGLGVAGAYAARQSQLDARARTAREAGREALAKGDWNGALEGYGRYLQRFMGRGATADDFVGYAKARRHIESPNGVHLTDSIAILRNAVELDPANSESKNELLDLYLQTGYATEALSLIEELLSRSPDDPRLLQTKGDLLEAQRRFKPALEVARRINSLAAGDLDGYFRTLRLLTLSDASASEIDDWLGVVMRAHEGDQRFELLRTALLARRNDEAGARESLDRALAASATSKDPRFIALLVRQLDAAARFQDALTVLDAHASAADPELLLELARRLWYAGRAPDLLKRFSSSKIGTAVTDPELIALQALALNGTGRTSDAAPLRMQLAARTDKAGAAWNAYVGRLADARLAEPGAVEAMRDAASVAPSSALIREALGDAYAAVGETELALDAWKAASSFAPSWALPLRNIADALVKLGREHVAQMVAHEAMARSPNDIATIETYLRAAASTADELTSAQIEKLLSAVRLFEKEAPGRVDETLPLSVGLLSRVDKAAAEARLREALASATTTKSSETTLLRLAQIAARIGTSLEGQFLDLSESIYGVTPQLALAQAISHARMGGEDAGLRTIESLRSRPNNAPAVEWDLVRASFVDAVRRADSGRTWISVAETYPQELRAQLGALSSPAVWKERAAVEKIIDRVRLLTSEDGVTWRIARARWLLTDDSAVEGSIAEAAKILNDVTRAAPRSVPGHLLLAQALERLGNLTGSEEQLRAASEIAPEDTWIALEVARLAQRQDRPDVARRQLEKVLATQDLVPEQVERAAYLLAVQGEVRRSADLLEPLLSKTQARRDGILLLARLYAKLGESQRALSLCERLASDPDPEVVELTASLYAALGRTAEAEVALTRLAGLTSRAGERELQRAKFAASWGPPGAAKDWFRRAASAAPEREDVWTAWLSHSITEGDAESLTAILGDAKAGGSEPVHFLQGIRPLAETALRDARLRVLLLAMVSDKTDRPVLSRVLEIATRPAGDPSVALSIAQEVAAAADASVRVLAVQLVAAEICSSSGLGRRACEIGRRAQLEFPNSAAAAQSAAIALARAGKWKDAVEAGIAWRDRSSGRDQIPDFFLADAMLRCGRPGDAELRLRPYLPAALARPVGSERLLVASAVALSRNGHSAEASRLLEQLVSMSPEGRRVAFSVDPEVLGDVGSARGWFGLLDALPDSTEGKSLLALARSWTAAAERFSDEHLSAGARRAIEKVQSNSTTSADASALLGVLAQGRGDLGDARRNFEDALRINPRLVDVRNNLAMVLADLGEARIAVDQATQVTVAAPQSAECFDTLAYTLRKAGEPGRAQAALERAVRLDPANLCWRTGLAELHQESGASDVTLAQILQDIDALISAGAEPSEAVSARIGRLRPKSR